MAAGGSDQQMMRAALKHAERAVDLSLWDYRARRLLGALQEMNGNEAEAEKSLRAAVKLAPNHSEVNWVLANFLIRQGKIDESLELFRKAARFNSDFWAQAFDLLWQSSGQDLELLKSAVANDPTAQLSLVQYCLEKSLIDEALGIFRGMDREAKLSSPKSAGFIRSLINAGQFDPARALWIDLLASSSRALPADGSLVWNGGFEIDSVKNFDHFDWTITPSEYARIGIDARMARQGSRSLRVAFLGRDTTTLRGEIKQLVALQPGGRYHLECYAKTLDLFTPEGPRIAILGANGVIAASDPVGEGNTDWQRLAVDFNAPADAAPKFLTIVRIPKFSYDDPTRGTVWFDDFSLTEQPQQITAITK
jgi:tetratricopeptide (TPR) repeat protein